MMTTKEKLDKISEKTGSSQEELKKELEELYNKIEIEGMSEDAKKVMAINRLVSTYRKQLTSNAEMFKGVFIGASSSRDMVKNKRESAINHYKESPEDAIKKGIVNEIGEPLHYASDEDFVKMPEWAKKRIGTLLPKTDLQRSAIGIVEVKNDNGEGTGKYIPMQFRIRGKNTEIPIPFYVNTSFGGFKTQGSTEELAKINDSGITNYKVEKVLSDEEVIKILTTVFKDNFITISQIEKFVAENQDYGRMCVMKVRVTGVSTTITKNGNQIMSVEDDTMEFVDASGNVVPGITCWMHKDININFPEGSEIYVIGQPNVGEKGASINVYGIFVQKIFRNSVPETKDVETKW